jgi:hypothetical protein
MCIRFGFLALSSVLWLAAASPSLAADPAGCPNVFPLHVEFDDSLTGSFGSIEVQEDGLGGLAFYVELDPGALGPDADLHRLYFNLEGEPTGVGVETGDPVPTLYTVSVEPRVAGGAGSAFDLGVHFGNGSGRKGNGVLKSASFEMFADQALSVCDLSTWSSTASGIVVNMAVHVQNTALVEGSDSETLGGIGEVSSQPEPDLEPASDMPQ